MANLFDTTGTFKFNPIQATSPFILDNKYKPNKIMHEWQWMTAITGDDQGGYIRSTLDFSIFDINHHILITNIFILSSGGSHLRLETNTDEFINLNHPGITDEGIYLWNVATSNYGYANRDRIEKPIYLGRINHRLGSSRGICHFYADNDDGASLNILVQGYTLERPLPFSSIIQP